MTSSGARTTSRVGKVVVVGVTFSIMTSLSTFSILTSPTIVEAYRRYYTNMASSATFFPLMAFSVVTLNVLDYDVINDVTAN